MKHLILLLGLPFTGVNAQTDSLTKPKKLKLASVQLEAHGTTVFTNRSITQSKLQQFVTSDSMLYKDLSSYYTTPEGVKSVVYNSNIGARVYFTYPSNSKLTKDMYAGVVYGTGTYSQLNFSKETYDTLGVFTSTSTSQVLYQIQSTNDSYYFYINSNMLLMPLGVNFTTSKSKRVWFGFGVEVAPGLTFYFKYNASNYKFTREHIVVPTTPANNYNTTQPFNVTQFEVQTQSIGLKGVGFTGYIGTPVSANLRISKRIPFLDHTSFGVSVAPTLHIESNKYRGTHSGLAIASTMHLRYNFN